VLRTISSQLTLWYSILPASRLGLPGDLAEIDVLLDDERFFEPFRPFFDPVIGRPSIRQSRAHRPRASGRRTLGRRLKGRPHSSSRSNS